ncbi:MAG: MATE family efflux transporter [Proteobacteria bacterium]|nr:MATE family efflux transporter [Pseudomonadota bacterium]
MTSEERTPLSASTVGRHRQIWRLAGPIIVANLSVPLLGAVDTAVMGHLPDAKFLGGVAVGAIIFNFIYWGFGFLRMGTTGLTAQAYGANDGNELRAVFSRALMLAGAIGLLLWIIQVPLIWAGMTLFDASAEVEELARTYFQVRIWSAPAVLANYCLIGWFIGVQNTRAALILQIVLNGTNIILDLIFVLGLGMTVAGVAAATVLAEYATIAVGFFLMRRAYRKIGGTGLGTNLFDPGKLKRLVALNFDIMIRTLCLIGAFAFFTRQGARYGDATLAANAVLLQFQQFLSFGLDGFAHAAEALVGGAIGARDRQGFRETVKLTGIWAVIVAMLYTVVYAAAGGPIIGILTDIEEVRRIADQFKFWLVISPILSVWSFMLDGIFIGATRTAEMRNAMIASLAVFLASVWLLTPSLGNDGLWLSLMLFMIVRALALIAYYPQIERSMTQGT